MSFCLKLENIFLIIWRWNLGEFCTLIFHVPGLSVISALQTPVWTQLGLSPGGWTGQAQSSQNEACLGTAEHWARCGDSVWPFIIYEFSSLFAFICKITVFILVPWGAGGKANKIPKITWESAVQMLAIINHNNANTRSSWHARHQLPSFNAKPGWVTQLKYIFLSFWATSPRPSCSMARACSPLPPSDWSHAFTGREWVGMSLPIGTSVLYYLLACPISKHSRFGW